MQQQNIVNLPLNVLNNLKSQLFILEKQYKEAESLHSLVVSMGGNNFTLDYQLQNIKDKIDMLKNTLKSNGVKI